MICKIEEHEIGVDYDFNFRCRKCGVIFIPKELALLPGHASDKDVQKNLVAKFGIFWKLEWFKLIALRDVVRKIRLSKPTKNSKVIILNEDRTYTWIDFSEPVYKLNEYRNPNEL